MDQPGENDQQRGEDSEEEVQSRYTGVPFEFKNYIRALIRDDSMYIDDGILLIQKPLSDRDVDPQKARFSFTSSPTLIKKCRHDRSVILIEPSAQNQTSVYFRKKKKKKKSDEDSTMYVLDTSWNEVVTRNNLEAGQIVQLWAVGVDEKYCFVLHRLTTEEGNNAPGSSGGSSGAAANPSSSSSSSDSSDS